MEASLSQFLAQSTHLDNQSISDLLQCWTKEREFKIRESLLGFNEMDTNLYFVKSGCVRLFIVNKNGEESNLGFGYANSLITCFQSFIEGKPSVISIEAILPSTLIAIAKIDLMRLINTNAQIAFWYQSMLEQTLTGHIQRQVELLTLKPQERYLVFMKRSGHLINSIPLKFIASYLMMKPETLSRIRAKIS